MTINLADLNQEERGIITAFVSGNQKETNKAIEKIYKSYFEMIENLVVNNSGCLADADDLFQEVLVTFYKNILLGKFLEHSSIKTYFYAIARNTWITQVKKNKTLNTTCLENISDDIQPIENNSAKEFSDEQEILLTELLTEMKEDCRNILTDFYYKKLSLDAIKKNYKLASKQVAKTKKYRCLKKLIEAFNSKRSLIDSYN